MSAFGYSYLLDMYECRAGVADNLELHYRFLEELVDRLGMTKMSAPIVIHAPRNRGVEQFPEKAGVSGWVPLIESGIQIHSIEPTHFITLMSTLAASLSHPWCLGGRTNASDTTTTRSTSSRGA